MAKILSLEEALDADVFWYESHSVYTSEYGRVNSVDGMSVAIARINFTGWAYEDLRRYEISWRCWDKRPTDQERKSAPWKDEDDVKGDDE